ncbi:MAG: DNA-binding protein WhiA [Oscillospiraceae bacterium]|nr:DNA-binding protein WhiA [Oscillospiraceae bacterium]
MSFSSDTKSELCKAPMQKSCCALAELYGILLYCRSFTPAEVRIITEHRPFASRAEKLLKKAAGFGFDSRPADDAPGKRTLVLTEPGKLRRLSEMFGYDSLRSVAHHIDLGVLEEECCRASFIRGAFLAGGSVTAPSKGYHFELITGHYSVSREVCAILREMGFAPGSTSRTGNYVTYFKQSEAIEDILTTIGAPLAAMEIMGAKVEKEISNRVNRRLNCDEANLEKTVNASQQQLRAIAALERAGELDGLSDKLREAAVLRRDNPELTLQQLAALADPPVTKSCFNHRIRKITELAEKYAEKH